MANTYGITFANLGKDDNYAFCDDPIIYIKQWGELDTTIKALGYCSFSKEFKQKIDYAIMECGIPKVEIRRDPIKQTFTVEGTLYQIQKETLGLMLQRYVTTGDTYDAKTMDSVMIGEDIPEPVYISVIVQGKTVDKKNFFMFIRKARLISDDFEFVMGGDKHSEAKFSINCLVDGDPSTSNSEWPYDDNGNEDEDDILFFAWEQPVA